MDTSMVEGLEVLLSTVAKCQQRRWSGLSFITWGPSFGWADILDKKSTFEPLRIFFALWESLLWKDLYGLIWEKESQH